MNSKTVVSISLMKRCLDAGSIVTRRKYTINTREADGTELVHSRSGSLQKMKSEGLLGASEWVWMDKSGNQQIANTCVCAIKTQYEILLKLRRHKALTSFGPARFSGIVFDADISQLVSLLTSIQRIIHSPHCTVCPNTGLQSSLRAARTPKESFVFEDMRLSFYAVAALVAGGLQASALPTNERSSVDLDSPGETGVSELDERAID